MRHIANIISISRIVASILLLATNTFSIDFYIIYIYCGLSDMVDGAIARKTNTVSKIGAFIDSIADFTFVIVSAVKILPLIHINQWLWVWIGIIALLKVVNVIFGYVCYKKIVLLHTLANKVTGFFLFILPFIIIQMPFEIPAVILCVVATFAAVQEGYFIRKGITI